MSREEIEQWDAAVAAFRVYFNGSSSNLQENRLAWASMNKAAHDWCDRFVNGVRPVSPYAVASGR